MVVSKASIAHRSTGSRQQNKKHITKGPSNQGVPSNTLNLKLHKSNRVKTPRDQRRHNARRRMVDKKEDIRTLNQLGAHDSQQPAPRNLLLLSLNQRTSSADLAEIKARIVQRWTGRSDTVGFGPLSVRLDKKWGRLRCTSVNSTPRFVIYETPSAIQAASEGQVEFERRRILSILDSAKAADVIMIVMNEAPDSKQIEVDGRNGAFDNQGYELISQLKTQGLPIIVGVFAPTNHTEGKHICHNAKRFFESEFSSKAPFFDLTCDNQLRRFTTFIVETAPADLRWRSNRGWMLAAPLSCEQQDEGWRVKVVGYVRGGGLHCNQMVHLTGVGDGRLQAMRNRGDPLRVHDGQLGNEAPDVAVVGIDSFEQSEVDFNFIETRCPLLAEEVSCLTPQEWDERGALLAGVPNSAEDNDEADDVDVDLDSLLLSGVGGYMPPEDDEAREELAALDEGSEEEEEEEEQMERRPQIELESRSDDSMDLPDEIDTPVDELVQTKYKEFRPMNDGVRKSIWDHRIAMPKEYRNLYDMDPYTAVIEQACDDSVDEAKSLYLYGVTPHGSSGKYMELDLLFTGPNPAENLLKGKSSWSPLLISGLSVVETKGTIIHANFSLRPEWGPHPISVPDEVQIASGFRRFTVKGVTTEDVGSTNRGLLRKVCPIVGKRQFSFIGPCLQPDVGMTLSALHRSVDSVPIGGSYTATSTFGSGNLEGGDVRRVLLERVTLTGYPKRIYKRTATIRYMFHYPEDVLYYMTAELRTVRGKQGYIVAKLGEKGYFKARFDSQLDSGDIVCLDLFRRVHPPGLEN